MAAFTVNDPHKSSTLPQLKIAIGRGGVKDTGLMVMAMDFPTFARKLSTPKVGPKDGDYLIRGGDLIAPKRGNQNLKSGEFVILDGDKTRNPDGSLADGAPPLDEVLGVLDDLGLNYVAHTSHSYVPAVPGVPGVKWKYRVFIPAKLKNAHELETCVKYLIEKLHARGVMLADVPENSHGRSRGFSHVFPPPGLASSTGKGSPSSRWTWS